MDSNQDFLLSFWLCFSSRLLTRSFNSLTSCSKGVGVGVATWVVVGVGIIGLIVCITV